MRSILLVAALPAFVGAKTLSVDFSTFASSGLTVAQFLDQSSLYVSAYEVQTSYPSDPTADPFSHTFVTDNVDIQDGYLTLRVSGPTGQGASVLSAEVGTYDANILYGTFKTVAIASPVPGVVHGFFTYKNDCQESDIELLTSFYTTGNTFVQPGLQLTSQDLHNVPTESSSFLWNSWSGGNERWSAGPPTQDAILKIKSSSLEYETA
ncbi:hypothetical protein DICSQDRAFT_163639 [Dichomitus squalens LYAD-421 SS1]|uniref:Concanavalin A-like lectin/glucanase n=1 Tax=Dichomitus squalens (strain LYAD-421) TaxID=732165 RepID=R7SL85_DICSQ|nr:uncharacterized protein DICSQDRAFT_163639 [Dichomitus squalens LYAD-421 SS1]EJF56921.1 hypothetical protein DICSQDRAFT_163639 [Dichomitus squalens LYAD-421 SS1]